MQRVRHGDALGKKATVKVGAVMVHGQSEGRGISGATILSVINSGNANGRKRFT